MEMISATGSWLGSTVAAMIRWRWCPCRCASSNALTRTLAARVYGKVRADDSDSDLDCRDSNFIDVETGTRSLPSPEISQARSSRSMNDFSSQSSTQARTGRSMNDASPDCGRPDRCSSSRSIRSSRSESEFFDANSEFPDSETPRVCPGTPKSGTEGRELLWHDQRKLPAPTDADVALCYDVPLSSIQELSEDFPNSPPAELARYLTRKSVSGSTRKAAPLLRVYLEWRKKEFPALPPAPPDLRIPVRLNGHTRVGTRIILLLPCMIDTSFSPEAYANEMVRFLDGNFPREQTTRFTLLVDVRGHHALGYKPSNVIRIFRHVSSIGKAMTTYFPERLKNVIVYPFGDIETKAYKLIGALIPQATMDKIICLHDKAGCNAPYPPKELLDHISPDEIWTENRKFFEGL